MANILINLTPLFLFMSYLIYNFITISDVLKEPKLINTNKCKLLRGAVGIEDLVKYKKYLIGGSDDRGKLWEIPEYGVNKTPNGKMVFIDTSLEYINLKIQELKINNFPDKIAFHPHGIYLNKDKYIYAINHAYNKGGERVEVLEIINTAIGLELNYLRSIIYPDQYVGIFNDLVVVGDKDEILITKYLPFADSKEGRSHSLIKSLFSNLLTFIKLPLTYIYRCVGEDCIQLKGTDSLMNNGITYDAKNQKVYAVNVFEKRVRVYKIKRDPEFQLEFEKDIPTGFALDNVEFDKDTGLISAGVIGRTIDHFHIAQNLKKMKSLEGVGKRWGGSLIINTLNYHTIENTVIQNELFYGISSAMKVNNLIFHGSWVDDGLLVCNLEK